MPLRSQEHVKQNRIRNTSIEGSRIFPTMIRKEVSEIMTRKEISQNSNANFKGSRMILDFSEVIRKAVSSDNEKKRNFRN
jgi:hypothetical protein